MFGFHVIVYQKQFVLQVCTGKAVGFYLLQTARVHTVAEQFSQNQPDSGFSLAALGKAIERYKETEAAT